VAVLYQLLREGKYNLIKEAIEAQRAGVSEEKSE
jgi:hypothetical protein